MKPQAVRPVGAPRPRPLPRIEVSLERAPGRRRYGRPRAGVLVTLAGLLLVGVAVLVYQAEITPTVAVNTVVAMALPSPPPLARDASSTAAAAELAAPRQAAAPRPTVGAAPASQPAVMTGSATPAASAAAASGLAGQDSREVSAAVNAWVRAWSQRDMAAYFAAYGPDFKGLAKSRAAWQSERQDRITSKARIAVTVSELKIQVQGQHAEVKLTQTYESGALRTVGPKRLTLDRVGGHWLIQQELSGR